MGRKFDSIKQLQAFGFNVPDCVELTTWEELAEHIGNLPRTVGEPARRSFRTDQWQVNKITPHYPNAPITDDLINVLSAHLQGGLTIISAVPISPDWTVYAGNMHFKPRTFQEAYVILEWRDGPGTVRHVEEKGPHHSKTLVRSWPEWEREGCPDAFIKLFRDARVLDELGMDNHILEWSLLDRPIGVGKDPWIYWELRSA